MEGYMIIEVMIAFLSIVWVIIFVSYLLDERKIKKQKILSEEKLRALLKKHDQYFKSQKE